jgi:hypothetical protein
MNNSGEKSKQRQYNIDPECILNTTCKNTPSGGKKIEQINLIRSKNPP